MADKKTTIEHTIEEQIWFFLKSKSDEVKFLKY
jgi:hypothetical protein